MPIFAPSTHLRTHEVTNQPGPFAGYNLYLTDNALREAAQRDGGGWIEAPLRALGEAVGKDEVLDMVMEANRFPPELASFVLHGRRIDEDSFHPAYHALMMLASQHSIPARARANGTNCSPFAQSAPLAHVNPSEVG